METRHSSTTTNRHSSSTALYICIRAGSLTQAVTGLGGPERGDGDDDDDDDDDDGEEEVGGRQSFTRNVT